MTDDIVTRLREGFELKQGDFRDLLEAADEIERLRAENHGLRIRIFTLLKKLKEK